MRAAEAVEGVGFGFRAEGLGFIGFRGSGFRVLGFRGLGSKRVFLLCRLFFKGPFKSSVGGSLKDSAGLSTVVCRGLGFG